MNIEWLRGISFILPAAAMALNFSARFKKLTNERISVFKDIKPLCAAIEMEPYEIKAIDKEIRNLILLEATGIRDPLLARQHLKILSCNDVTDIQKSRIKRLAHCIDQETNNTANENKEVTFKLNKSKYIKKRNEGAGFLITFLATYYIFFFCSFTVPEKDVVVAIGMFITSIVLLVPILVTVATYPMYGFYKKNKEIIDSLNRFRDES
ncbi:MULTISPECIES: hypothetical protein [Erwiniaceae]|uniref:hypothetical protein n=1 Tax=Erwiniaceae TaxID=1903409 RepID=UPI00111CB82E|nr:MULTISPECIES: hypothetical protein [Erwiniaceae]MCW0938784.1 hypothetical protein [Pantoea sp. RG18]MDN4628764.1 hypothetical protein [Erwinia sp. PsM31]TPD89405.1 hypothetical protein FJP68_21580 [Pantoea vagans]